MPAHCRMEKLHLAYINLRGRSDVIQLSGSQGRVENSSLPLGNPLSMIPDVWLPKLLPIPVLCSLFKGVSSIRKLCSRKETFQAFQAFISSSFPGLQDLL